MRTSLLAALVLAVILPVSVLAQRDLNTDRSTLFSGSGNCQLCHAAGNGANTSSTGEDVSPPAGWRSSMMASAARDPYWQASVSAEAADHPELTALIEDKCTNCHVPMGHEQAHANGAASYSLAEARADGLAMDAVSCTLCHQVVADNFGTAESFSGGYKISGTRVTFGPYTFPLIQPMKNVSGFEPVYSSHIEQAELCATCHTLFTPFLDAQGQIAGEFPEQTPYLEWKASAYPASGTSCQTCHMPAVNEAMRISTLPQSAPPRTPVFAHHFVGGNTIMLGVMKTHADELGATAMDMHYDSSLARTRAQLQRAAGLSSPGAFVRGGELSVSVAVANLTGHKFPTGFPSRRAWLHVTVKDADQRTVFESGEWTSGGEIPDVDAPFEPHHPELRGDGDVQIWESVMGDVGGDVTETLLHAASYLKDNRIPPRGYSALAMASDTIGAVGTDGDSEYIVRNGEEYAGTDRAEYRIAIEPAWKAPFDVQVDLCYQTIKPEFIRNLARHDTPEITRFRGYHDAAPVKVEVLQTLRLVSQEVNAARPVAAPAVLSLEIFPRPVSRAAGELRLRYELAQGVREGEIAVFDLLGRQLLRVPLHAAAAGPQTRTLDISALRPGMYFTAIIVGKERRVLPLCVAP